MEKFSIFSTQLRYVCTYFKHVCINITHECLKIGQSPAVLNQKNLTWARLKDKNGE